MTFSVTLTVLAPLVALAAYGGWRALQRRQDKQRAAQVESYQRTHVGSEGWVTPPPNPLPSTSDAIRAVIGSDHLHHDTQPFTDTATLNAMQEAKQLFMRLIAAWDSANADELRLLLTSTAYASLIDEANLAPRPGAPTDILTLAAEAVNPEQSSKDHSDVRFSGMYRTALSSAARSFDAVWSLERGPAGLQVARIEPI